MLQQKRGRYEASTMAGEKGTYIVTYSITEKVTRKVSGEKIFGVKFK